MKIHDDDAADVLWMALVVVPILILMAALR